MAIEIYVRKVNNILMPSDIAQAELLDGLKPNSDYKAILTQPRNPLFHRKAFALSNIGFNAWIPPDDRQYKGRSIAKNFDSFRDELTIRAGFFDPVWKIGGEMRLKPHSWSWGETDQEKFERMYSGFIDVILRDVLSSKLYTQQELERQVELVLGFS